MPILVHFIVAVWVAVFLHRRRWQGAIILIGATAVMPLIGRLIGMITEAGGSVSFPLAIALSVVMCAIGVLLYIQPRQIPSIRCRQCKYDLDCNTTGVCPECGTTMPQCLARQSRANAAKRILEAESEHERMVDSNLREPERQPSF
ncbi:MAG: hypothetical protein AAGD00_03510 [Planctomycetota bacterium]